MSQFIRANEGPYTNISRDERLVFGNRDLPNAGLRRVQRADGLIGSGCNGIAMLDEDEPRRGARQALREDAPATSVPAPHQLEEADRIRGMTKGISDSTLPRMPLHRASIRRNAATRGVLVEEPGVEQQELWRKLELPPRSQAATPRKDHRAERNREDSGRNEQRNPGFTHMRWRSNARSCSAFKRDRILGLRQCASFLPRG